LFVAPLTAVVLGGSAAGVSLTPLFEARRIVVGGNVHLSAARIERLARAETGVNVVWFDESKGERRLLRDPWISRADVVRHLPRTIEIRVHERVPVAQVDTGDAWALLSGDGTVLARVRRDRGLPRIGGSVYVPPVGATSTELLPITSAVAPMGKWLRSNLALVDRDPDLGIVLTLAAGTRVMYGDPRDAAVKARSLAGVLRWADRTGRRVASIDVRAPYAPAASVGPPGVGAAALPGLAPVGRVGPPAQSR
jgi:cell division protein FtsQ